MFLVTLLTILLLLEFKMIMTNVILNLFYSMLLCLQIISLLHSLLVWLLLMLKTLPSHKMFNTFSIGRFIHFRSNNTQRLRLKYIAYITKASIIVTRYSFSKTFLFIITFSNRQKLSSERCSLMQNGRFGTNTLVINLNDSMASASYFIDVFQSSPIKIVSLINVSPVY